jgi:hypothetical protein
MTSSKWLPIDKEPRPVWPFQAHGPDQEPNLHLLKRRVTRTSQDQEAVCRPFNVWSCRTQQATTRPTKQVIPSPLSGCRRAAVQVMRGERGPSVTKDGGVRACRGLVELVGLHCGGEC